MGRRQRRRDRERAKAKAKASKKVVQRYLYPSKEQPLLEVHFEPEVSEADKDTCLQYWAFTEPGSWLHKVSEIGASVHVSRTVKASCHASLLTVLCPECTAPKPVGTRSDVVATRLWRSDTFPRTEVTSKAPCRACGAAQEEARELEDQRAQERERKASEERVSNAGAWIAKHDNGTHPDEPPTARDALAFLAVIDIMERTGNETFGPLKKLDYTLSPTHSTDVEIFRNLYQQRWIVPTLPATVSDFAFNDDNTVRGVYIAQVPWRLSRALGKDASQARQVTAQLMRRLLLEDPAGLKEVMQVLEAETAVNYLDHLLMRKYDEEPIPEHRLQDAYETFHTALVNGFNLRQLLAVAWSATASSVAWGQRTPGLKPGSVSSAAVTNLGRRIGYAKDRPVPEYDLPNWVPRLASHTTAVRLLEQHAEEIQALDKFQSLQQRIASRDLEAFELDGDLADSPDPDTGQGTSGGLEVDKYLEELRSGIPPQDKGTPITYALVHPDGSLEFRTETARAMRDKVSLAGCGYVDRVMLPDPPTVNAYVAELPSATAELANPVANEMLSLLGNYDGPFFGPISFFGFTPGAPRPRSLDDEHQDLLRAAHQVAQARSTALH